MKCNNVENVLSMKIVYERISLQTYFQAIQTVVVLQQWTHLLQECVHAMKVFVWWKFLCDESFRAMKVFVEHFQTKMGYISWWNF